MIRGQWKSKDPEELKKYTFFRQWKDCWRYSEGIRAILIVAIVLAVISGALAIVPSFLYGKIVEDLTNSKFASISLYLILLAVSYIIYHFIDRIIDHIVYLNNLKARNKTRLKLYNSLFRLDFDFFEKHSSGSIMNQINEGVGDFTRFNKRFYRLYLIKLFSFIFALVTIFYLEPIIPIVGIITIIIYMFWVKLTEYTKIKLEYDASLERDKEQAKIHDYLGHILLVKLLNIKDNLIKEMKKAQNKILAKHGAARNYMNKIVFVRKIILDLSYVIVLFILARQVMGGEMSVGIAVTIYALYAKFISEFKGVRENYQDMLNTRPSMFKLSKLWKHKPLIEEPKNPKKISTWNRLKFENVTFKYPSKKQNTLDDISFEVKKGEKLGIVGLSGGGKSTVSKLLFKMYLPNQGKIKIGKTDIRDVNSLDLYKVMKIVPQENELINATIYENLKFGAPKVVSREEIIDSLKKSHAWEFVKKLPKKMNTLVGPNGIKLSGGEKQRLCIARALLSKPELLVLDEATAHLDVLTEKKIHDSLHNLGENQTVIAITHRISSMYLFDRILVIDKGKIVGEGKHNKLLNSNKYYQKLWKQSKKLK
jgi:ATP-binding cassette, subfamily B, bacterial